MPDLHLERDFDVTPAELWALVTTPAGLLQWWGPEGTTVPEHALDFTKTGPWHSVMLGGEGQRYKVSGQVTKITPMEAVSFTWAWHDDADQRGHESHVTLQLQPLGATRARLILSHVDLVDDESLQNHQMGWTSSLRKLTRQYAST